MFPRKINEYALTFEGSCIFSNIPHVANLIRDLDIDLKVYDISNGITI